MTDIQMPFSAAAQAATPATIVQGERHASDVAGRAMLNRKAGIGVIVAGAAIACGAILLTSTRPSLDQHGPEAKPSVGAQQSYVAPPRDPAPPAPAPVPASPAMPPPPEAIPAGMDMSAHSAAKLLVFSSGSGAGMRQAGGTQRLPSGPDTSGTDDPTVVDGIGSPDVAPHADSGRDVPRAWGNRPSRGDDLASRLTPTRLTGVSATVLRHQSTLLTTGTMIPCILQTAMDSTLPGLVTCVVPEDVMGKTGLTLLDRGTRIVGEFRGGVTQGVERMFVVWSRAETPQGVVIALDSPATDPLGRSGMDGDVDRHFWQRFGGALLMTTVDGAVQAGVAQASQAGTTTINTGSTENVIDDALRGSVALPPTIRKNQGELVSILVARDLDFAGVYRLRPNALERR